MFDDLAKQVTKLGESKTEYSYGPPDKGLLEYFNTPKVLLPASNASLVPAYASMVVEIKAPEFTSLCPKTGQPDFATIVIRYRPNDRCVESKSLKLYLGSFRNHGEFHEACVTRIAQDLIELLNPKYLRVEGQFTPRGGIPFWPTVEYYAEGEPLDVLE